MKRNVKFLTVFAIAAALCLMLLGCSSNKLTGKWKATQFSEDGSNFEAYSGSNFSIEFKSDDSLIARNDNETYSGKYKFENDEEVTASIPEAFGDEMIYGLLADNKLIIQVPYGYFYILEKA